MLQIGRAMLVICLTAFTGFAQTATIRCELRDLPAPPDRFTVHLVKMDGQVESQRALGSGSADFSFHSVRPGNYVLEVRDAYGEVVKQQMISVAGPAFETSISLARTGSASSVPKGLPQTVALNQLRRDPDGRAAHEFQLAAEAMQHGDAASARKHLLKSLKTDPDSPQAHLELGTIAFRSGDSVEARLEFKRAAELQPDFSLAWSNLASLEFHDKHFEAAGEAALNGLKTAPRDAKLHFLAGASSVALNQFDRATAEHLERAVKDYPNAHIVLAEVLLRQGDNVGARPHLEESRASPIAEVRRRATLWLGKLELAAAKGGGLEQLQCASCAPRPSEH